MPGFITNKTGLQTLLIKTMGLRREAVGLISLTFHRRCIPQREQIKAQTINLLGYY